MRNEQYFKHDVSAASNPKLMTLLQVEGAKGYGVYWVVLETLRMQVDFRLPLSVFGVLARKARTRPALVARVVLGFDLFVVDGNFFYSPGMNRRMRCFVAKRFGNAEQMAILMEGNPLGLKEVGVLSARKEEQSREEENSSSNNTAMATAVAVAGGAAAVAAGGIAAAGDVIDVVGDVIDVAAGGIAAVAGGIAAVDGGIDAVDGGIDAVGDVVDAVGHADVLDRGWGERVGALPLPVARPWEALVDEMGVCQEWMDLTGLHSGLGELYVGHHPQVLELFKDHIRRRDKGGSLFTMHDMKEYYANCLRIGSWTCQSIRGQLLQQLAKERQDGQLSPYETFDDGQRTYLGRCIPEDAPPRPDACAVWDESTKRWRR